MTLTRQLEELQLLQCSLLSGELLRFIDNAEIWSSLLAAYPDILDTPNISETRFQVKLDNAHIWFEVELPSNYPNARPVVSVKGDVARGEQDRWQSIVREKMQELESTEYQLYELFSAHLLPLLHAKHDSTSVSSARPIQSTSSWSTSQINYHALLTSHHLVSPRKRRSLQQWSSDLRISGFAKVGYPGVIYAEGTQGNVDEFVANVKAMQWLALRVRFVEPIDEVRVTRNESRWVEFQKVGEVVEEMKRIGREGFILEMGIGSAGSK